MKLKVFDTPVAPALQSCDRCAILFQPSPISVLGYEEVRSKQSRVRFMTSDLSLLFNQQRLMSLGQGAIDYVLQMVKSKSADPLEGLTDDQLVSLIKSRYIQSQADVYNWTRYVQNNIDTEIQAMIDAQSAGDPPAGDPPSGDPPTA